MDAYYLPILTKSGWTGLHTASARPSGLGPTGVREGVKAAVPPTDLLRILHTVELPPAPAHPEW